VGFFLSLQSQLLLASAEISRNPAPSQNIAQAVSTQWQALGCTKEHLEKVEVT